MPRYLGVNHLAMATRDMDATLSFWRDLLGMRLVACQGRAGSRQYFLEVSDRDMIAFFEWPDVEPLEEKDHGYPVKGPFGFDHVSFGVERQDDLWDLKDRLEAAGFWVSEAIDHGFFHSIYSFDPNGVPIEFTWAPPERDPRLRPLFPSESLTPAAREGAGPVPGRWPAVTKPTAPEDRVLYPGEGGDSAEKSR